MFRVVVLLLVLFCGACIRYGYGLDAAHEGGGGEQAPRDGGLADHSGPLDLAAPRDSSDEGSSRDRSVDAPECQGAAACDDGLRCTVDTCPSGVCQHAIESTSCLIKGQCVAASTANPTNACEVCDPARSASGWSTVTCVSTLAGSGAVGFANGAALAATLNTPDSVAVSSTGLVYFTDKGNHAIRLLSGGQVTTVAGNGTAGFVNGPVNEARFDYPSGLAVDGAGKIYIADSANHVIRLISGGQVSTLAGTGSAGLVNGAAAAAQFNFPTDVAVDSAGNLYVADFNNNVVRLIAGGQVSTFAGSGAAGFANGAALSASFRSPDGVAVDASGQVYVVDRDNHSVRLIARGQVSTFAGSGTAGYVDGAAATAKFTFPRDVVVGSAGRVYVADRYGQRIRVILGGQVSTLAGNGTAGFADGPAATASFHYPHSVAIDGAGHILVADADNHRLRLITP